MAEKSTFVKFDRNIKNWGWYTDLPTFKLFFHLITYANYTDGVFLGQTIKRGQIAKSLPTLASETGLTVKQVRTSLDKLEKTGEVARKGQAKTTLITVINYDKYQVEGRQRADKGHLLKNNKEEERNKEVKEDVVTDSDLNQIIELFNNICKSYPEVKVLNKSRKNKISLLKSKLNNDDILKLFHNAENSDFLKGNNKNNWKANFDWIIDEKNFSKIIEGNYDKKFEEKKGNNDINNFHQRDYDCDKIMEVLRRKQNEVM